MLRSGIVLLRTLSQRNNLRMLFEKMIMFLMSVWRFIVNLFDK